VKLRWTGDTAYSNDVARSAKNSGLLQTGAVVDVPNALGEQLLASNGKWELVADKSPGKGGKAKPGAPDPDSTEGEAEL
jgi:hypothetical protein